MELTESLFQIGLTHVLAVIGLVASLFVWRAPEIRTAVVRISAARERRRAGALGMSQTGAGVWGSSIQLVLWLFALACFLYGLLLMFRFIDQMSTLYDVADRLDLTVIDCLRAQASSVRDSTSVAGGVSIVLLLSEWVVGLGVDDEGARRGSEFEAHLFRIPSDWRDAPAEMWRSRLDQSSDPPDDTWRTEWSAWARAVGAVRDGRLDTVGDQDSPAAQPVPATPG